MIWQYRHIHAIMSKLEHYWRRDNNYTEKLATKRLNQITYDFFFIFEGSWQVAKHCAWSSNINQLIVELIVS
jgi:hypothetical protein